MKKAGKLRKGKAPAKSIMEYTGPGAWTDAVFSYFNNKEYFDFRTRKTNVTYSDFFGIREHKRIGDVVVLPITSFSPGVGQMGSEGVDHPMAFVKHEFFGMLKILFAPLVYPVNKTVGSWKPENERMVKK